ncbi:FdhF/YdeP family oxidoreductase [Mucilaginibacter ginkgonis]|uniref:FdhF/YdeP family oxidoreductase n=1 Tax=Mucilaginibacter ginkgonis TaxID=2682091 RepID=A0A6I4HYB7_9SPHI|nr:FdhF/YdeP family oxidoreductase [Mucilaginibacter ginkgonis]QQL51354.1 FdhF/YdeP family oxidoreductase [Mucilaginibacter ginkgonis]
MSKELEEPAALNPEKLQDIELEEPKKWAAGIPAITASFADILQETGATRGMGALLKMNQKGGFDCSSCAWPDPDDDRSPIAEYCENGAKALAEEATLKKLTPEFFAENSVADLAALTDMEIGKKGRIAQPVYLPKGATHYQPISWDDAFKKIATHLNGLNSPNEAVFYTSGRTSNEASFLYQLFVREFGTNNMPDCSNMCHESTSVALADTIGIGKGTVTLDDIHNAEVIIIMGQNPGTNHPRMLTALRKAKENNAKIIAVNPLKEAGLMAFKDPQTVRGFIGTSVQIADVYLQVKINGDMALLKALELLLYQAELKAPGAVFDKKFIDENTSGYEDLITHIKTFNLNELSVACGVPTGLLQQAADILAAKSKIVICWAMGITQHVNGVAVVNEIVNLALLKGAIGKPGAGLCPVRGHSNVQGNRTMLIWDKAKPEQLAKIKEVYGFDPPEEEGVDVVKSIKAMHEGKLKVFFAMGGNFLSATPDTNYTAEAMRKLKLSVHVSTKLNRSHLVHGEEALILPALARSDKDMINGIQQIVSCENSMGVVQESKGMLQPISDQMMSEPLIVCNLAKATLGAKSMVPWDKYAGHYDNIRDDIEKVVPGHEEYNKEIRKKGGFYIPNGPRAGKFNSKKVPGKAVFSISPLPVHDIKDGEYFLTTIRSHDQFNTTVYGLHDRYRGINNERRVVLMNEKDIALAGLKAGDRVNISSHYDGVKREAKLFVIVRYDIPDRNVAVYYPEGNILVPLDHVAEKSNCPATKMVFVRINKHKP